MLRPRLAVEADNFGVLELKDNVAEILGERLPKEAPDVLENESFWPNGAHDVHCVWEHVALIAIALVLAADGKGLAWRAARDKLDSVLPLGQVDVANVIVEEPKVGAHRAVPVLPQGVAGIGVAFDNGDGIEASVVQPEGKATAARKKFNRVHPGGF